jgi:hypothetical protein
VLELVEAPAASIDATKGVYKVCVHENLADFFAAQSPADATLAANYSIQAAEASNARLTKWFTPFFPGQIGGSVHPYFHEEPWGPLQRVGSLRLSAVEPAPPPEVAREEEGVFRVCIRLWHDDFLEGEEMFRMPGYCRFRVKAANAEAAREAAVELFPEGAVERNVFDDEGEVRLDSGDIARLSIDVQRIGLEQSFKAHTSFNLTGTLGDDLPDSELPRFAGHLSENFPAAVVATEDEYAFFAVTVHGESYEEAEADFHESIEALMDALGLEGEPINGYSTEPGSLNAEELWRKILIYRRRRR